MLGAIQENSGDTPFGSQPPAVVGPASRDTVSRSVRFSVKTPDAAVMTNYDDHSFERNVSPEPVKQCKHKFTVYYVFQLHNPVSRNYAINSSAAIYHMTFS